MFIIVIVIFSSINIASREVVSALSDGVTLYDLEVEYFSNPTGLGESEPRLSWKLESKKRNILQTAYQIQVSKKADFAGKNIVWDTGRIRSDKSVHVTYKGPEPVSRQRYYWRVRVWDNHNRQSDWSDTAYWEMGLLNRDDWSAVWIEPGLQQDTTKAQPVPMVRDEFNLDEDDIASARLYVTSHGLYEIEINGKRVGDRLFTPGWTSYNKRLQYQTYDITKYVKKGVNAIGARLGDGWFRGWLGFNQQRNIYGSELALLAQMEITFSNGQTRIIGTDGSWKAATGAVRKSDIYDGETYDARLEQTGWSEPGFDERKWEPVQTANYSKKILVAPDVPPVRKIQQLHPVDILTTSEGDTVVDMGQNMVGWIQMEVSGPKGTKVTLKHAEILDKKGNFYTANLRGAAQTDTYILKGERTEIFEPHFTFHGFRYVKVEGYPGELTKDKITGVVIHSDMEPTGHFQSSNAMINQLQHNIVWGQKGNFLDVPTDCPQRDERLGWTGDIQVFAQTACYNMDAAGFLTKWLEDLEADQLSNGSVPFVIPNILGDNAVGAAGWADAAVIVPWTLYQAYGDVAVLQQQYDSMKGWVEYVRKQAQSDNTTYLWDNGFTFGDWLAFTNDPDGARFYPGAYTNTDLIKTAYFARSTDLLRKTAEILDKEADATDYASLFDKIREAFQNEYLTPGGRVMSDTQTSYLLALQFGLLPDAMENEAAMQLARNVEERGHLTTGFLGTPHLNPVLTQYGYTQQAYDLLLRKQYPSWLYPITMGATTIWERWDGIKPDSTLQDPSMNSFNHYAYGAIGEWLYRSVAGIEADSPGYKKIKIHPKPGGKLQHGKGILNTRYGQVVSSWNFADGTFSFRVKIPENTQANIILPYAERGKVMLDSKSISTDILGILDISQENGNLLAELGSGSYVFTYLSTRLSDLLTPYRFSILSTLGELMADREAREILKQQLPEIINDPILQQAPPQTSLKQLGPAGYLSDKKMQSVDNALKKLGISEKQLPDHIGINTKLGVLIAHQQSREILEKELPNLMQSPWLSQVMGFSLREAIRSLPERYHISEAKLDALDTALRGL